MSDLIEIKQLLKQIFLFKAAFLGCAIEIILLKIQDGILIIASYLLIIEEHDL